MRGKLTEKLTLGALKQFALRTGCTDVQHNEHFGTMLTYRNLGRVMMVQYNHTTEELTWSEDYTQQLRPIFIRLLAPGTVDQVLNKSRSEKYKVKDIRLSKEMRACLLADNLIAGGAAADTITIDSLPDGRFTVRQILADSEQALETVRG